LTENATSLTNKITSLEIILPSKFKPILVLTCFNPIQIMQKKFTSFFFILMTLLCASHLHAQNQLHSQVNLDYLKSMNSKSTLTEPEKTKIRETMLTIMNEARKNPNYRKQQGCKTALILPSNLKPMFVDDRLNKLAQQQADYQASIKTVTHANNNFKSSPGESAKDYGYNKRITQYPNSGPEACAGTKELADIPIMWMKSETHYRPTWNLDGDKSTGVGFGIAKGTDGYWYATAVWGSFIESEAITTAHKQNLGTATTAIAPGAVTNVKKQAGSIMKPGDKLIEGQSLVSANGLFQLRGTSDGNFVVEDIKSGAVYYTFPLSGPINNPPSVSFFSYNPDGNICIDSKQNKGYCATDGQDAMASVILHKSDRAIVTNDGRFVLLNKQGREIWSTKSRHIITKWGYVVTVNGLDDESQSHTLKLGDEMFIAPYKQEKPHRVLVQGYTYDIFAVGKGGNRAGSQTRFHVYPDPDRTAWIKALKEADVFKVVSVSNTGIHPYNAYTLSAQQAVPNGPIQLTFDVYKEDNGKRQQLLSTFTVETKPMKWPL
jgi:uncharacterized protein YkwD